MAAKDIITKEYMKDASIFADAFNSFLFDGEPVIDPLKLHAMDTTEITVPYGAGNTEAPVQKFRDNLKYLTAMTDETAAYLILGIENQTDVQMAMPVKNMVYDALQYAAQVEKAAKSHRKAEKERTEARKNKEKNKEVVSRPNSKEYLSGFYQDDQLVPVITLVILFNPAPWDGPISIHEMLSVKDERILSFVPDYKVNLVAPASIKDSDFEKFHTSLKEVLSFIKYSQDTDRLWEAVEAGEGFRHLGRAEVEVLNACAGANLEMEKDKEAIDVCDVFENLTEKWVIEEKRSLPVG